MTDAKVAVLEKKKHNSVVCNEIETIYSAGKVPVFDLLKFGVKVYTKIIADAKSTTLIPVIETKVIPDNIVYSDCWRGHNTLDTSEFKHIESITPNYLLTNIIILTV